MSETIVNCICVSNRMKRSGETIQLRISKARRMEKDGDVKIVDPEEQQQVPAGTVPAAAPGGNEKDVRAFNRTTFRQFSDWPRIAWIQDFSRYGGAEYSNLYVIKIGESLGFDIVGVTPKTFYPDIVKHAHVVILNNIFEFDEKQLKELKYAIFENKKKFIKYDHDMRELGRLPTTRCFFERSMFNVFLSPAHASAYEKEHINGMALPLAIDTGFWKATGTERKPNACIIPTYHKGPENHDKYIAEHKDMQFTVLGRRFPEKRPNIAMVNPQPPAKMRDLYSKHEYMVHLPKELWAGERVYFEAALCGCKLMVNENVGHASWFGLTKEIQKNDIAVAPYTFWKNVEDAL